MGALLVMLIYTGFLAYRKGGMSMEICTPLAVKRFLSALKADIHAATVSAGCEFILCLPHACEEGRFFFIRPLKPVLSGPGAVKRSRAEMRKSEAQAYV